MGAGGCSVLCMLLTGVALFVSCFLLGFSFDTLGPGEMGVMFNQNTQRLECEQVYGATRDSESRRWFTGLGRGFYDYRFPMSSKYVLFSNNATSASETLVTKTKDGATVTMDVAVQYRLPRTQPALCAVIYSYGFDYNAFVITNVRGVARDAVASFLVGDLWQQRSVVGNAVKSAIATAINNLGLVFVGSQLLSLDIPSELQSAIEDTSVQEQRIFTAQLNLARQNVSAITRQLQAEVSAQVSIINAQAGANAAIVLAQAAATALQVTTAAEAAGYAAFGAAIKANSSINTGSATGLTPMDVLGLAWIDTVSQMQARHLVVSVASPAGSP